MSQQRSFIYVVDKLLIWICPYSPRYLQYRIGIFVQKLFNLVNNYIFAERQPSMN